MNKSKSILLALALLPIAAMTSCSKDDSSQSGKVEYIPVQLTQNGAWTFINEKGERIGDQQWDNEPTVTVDGIFAVKGSTGIDVYRWSDTKAEVIDSLTGLMAVGEYNEGLMPISAKGKRIQLVDKKGKVKAELNPIDGKEIVSCGTAVHDGLLTIRTDEGNCGVVNKKGEVIVQPEYNDISDFNNGLALAVKSVKENDYYYNEYYVIDKKGEAKRVEGKYAPAAYDNCGLSGFRGGYAVIIAADPADNNENDWDNEYNEAAYVISPDATVKRLDGQTAWYLDNGSYIVYKYTPGQSDYVWFDAEGKEIMNVSATHGANFNSASLDAYQNYVAKMQNNEITLYNDKGEELNQFTGAGWFYNPGGDFGLIINKYSRENERNSYQLLDKEGKLIGGVTMFGVGMQTYLTMVIPEGDCDILEVMSAYFDPQAAAEAIANALSGTIIGKSTYSLGMPVSVMVQDMEYNFYNGNGYGSSVSVPVNDGNELISVPGFWTWANAIPSSKFDNDAIIDAFDFSLSSTYPSAGDVREAIKKKLLASGYSAGLSNDRYDEYQKGDLYVIVYGRRKSHTTGVRFGRIYLSETEKNDLLGYDYDDY